MAEQGQPDLILGTAGHIDHGKSSLILALTGTDPDRLVEEKKRGITIELGFARLTLPDGRTMGVVDVPGHERFVRQMIAGSTGVDVALLCIAADDGIMPQTVEHIAVLQTLDVRTCVIALTKIDLVDEEWAEFMEEEIAAYMANTPYAGCPIVAVSSRTGYGLDALKQQLQNACSHTVRNKQGKHLRLPVDRVFTIKGSGTVITGTLWNGEARAGQTVEVLPQGLTSRIRSVQVHSHPVDAAYAGMRVALNLSDLKKNDIHPGCFLASPGTLRPTDCFDAYLTYIDTAKTGKPLESGVRMHVSHGTSEVLGRVLLCNGKASLGANEGCYAQIRLEEPLPVSSGDRFIVRTYSPVAVAGGGQVLLSHPRRRTNLNDTQAALLDALREGRMDRAVELAVAAADEPVSAASVASRLDLDEDDCARLLAQAAGAGTVVSLSEGRTGGPYVTPPALAQLLDAIESQLVSFHKRNPSATGCAKNALRRAVAPRMDASCFDLVLNEAVKAGKAVLQDGEVGHPSSQGAARKALDEACDELARALRRCKLAAPGIQDLAAEAGIDAGVARKAVRILVQSGRAERIDEDFYLDRQAFEDCKAAIAAHIENGGAGAIGDIKDMLGISRKFAVPILEHCDAIGFTVRVDNARVLKKK